MRRVPLIAMLCGLVALYVGERVLGGAGRYVFDILGGLLVLGAAVAAGLRLRQPDAKRRWAAGRIAVHYGLTLLGLLLYVAQSDLLGWVAYGQVRTLVLLLWPTLVLLGMLPAMAMESAWAGMRQAPKIETWRIRAGARSARIIALGLIAFAGINYAASAWNQKVDLTYFKTTKAGTATRNLIDHLNTGVEFVLFFPPGNAVLEQVRAYLQPLASRSDLVSIRVVDQPKVPELSRELKVRRNGYVVVRAREKTERIRLALDIEDARRSLKELDADVHNRLLEVLRPPRVAYFTTGHQERDWAPSGDDGRPGLSDFRRLLRTLGFTVKRLGLREGLASELPDDATVVVVAGPLEPFTAAEREALLAYMRAGGKLLWLVDPDNATVETPLLAELGIAVDNHLLADDRYVVRIPGRGDSPYDIVTGNFGSHPSVRTLGRLRGREAVAFSGAGSLHEAESVPGGLDVSFTLHTMSNTWADADANGRLDKPSEKRARRHLAAAISGTLGGDAESAATGDAAAQKDAAETQTAAAEASAQTAGNTEAKASSGNGDGQADDQAHTATAKHSGGSGDAGSEHDAAADSAKAAASEQLRAIVVADADMAADGLLYRGNQLFLADGLRWLAGEEQTAGRIESEKDIPITHRKDEDAIWFYGGSFAVPAVVLGIGLSVSRRRKRRSR